MAMQFEFAEELERGGDLEMETLHSVTVLSIKGCLFLLLSFGRTVSDSDATVSDSDHLR